MIITYDLPTQALERINTQTKQFSFLRSCAFCKWALKKPVSKQL